MSLQYPSLRQGLVGAWCPSLGASGFLLPNRARQSNNATHSGAITAAPGGTTLDLSGTQFADLGSAATLYPSLTSVTFSGWVRMRSFTNAYNTLSETQTDTSASNNYQFTPLIKSNGKLAVYAFAGVTTQSNYDGTGAFTLAANTWYHLCFTFLGGVSLAGYVNGTLDANVSSPIATLAASAGPVRIGNSVFGTRTLNGQLDDIRIYSRALTLAEIRLLASQRGIGLRYAQHYDDDADLQQYPIVAPPNRLHANVDGVWVPGQVRANTAGTWGNGETRVNVAGVWTPPSFDPRSIPGLAAWYDAADSSSVTLDSGRVSQWSDKSGNARHATNATSGSTQPSYTTAGRNGLNVLTFAAASVQRLTVPSSTAAFNYLHNGTESYIAAVSVYGTVANPQALYGLFGNNASASATPGVFLLYQDTGGGSPNDALRIDITAGGGVVPANSLNAANNAVQSDNFNLAPATTVVVQEYTLDADNATASQRTRIRVNGGTEVASNNKTATPSTGNAGFDFQLGATGNNVLPLQGDICELMFFNQLPTASDRNMIRQYLSAKWGVTLA